MAATAPAIQSLSALAHYAEFSQVVDLIRHHRDVKLLVEVETCLRLVSYSAGRIEFQPTADAPADLAQRLGARLQLWTGARWAISIASEAGEPTIAETRDAAQTALKVQAREHPLVAAVLLAFPGAEISDIRTAAQLQAEAAVDALPEVEDSWDPFEDD